MDAKEDKVQRILDLYTRLLNGETISKKGRQFILGSWKGAFSVTLNIYGSF